MRMSIRFTAGWLTLFLKGAFVAAAEEGTLRVGAGAEFQPRFVVLQREAPVAPVSVKWTHPVYNLAGWKDRDRGTTADVFSLAEPIVLEHPEIERRGASVTWRFAHEKLDLVAEIVPPSEGAEFRMRYTFTPKVAGTWSVAFAGAPAVPAAEVEELFLPLVWNERRLPEQSFLIPDDHCSIPGALVRTKSGTIGVFAEPGQFPFTMPNAIERRFGVAVRNRDGFAQPLVFAPFPGAKDSVLKAGESRSFEIVLVATDRPLDETFEHVARDVCGFRDRRENTLVSLNTALENILGFALSEAGEFRPKNRAFHYPDSKGTVKNVSALHPISLAAVTDDERLFVDQGVPILEYLLSREKFLFALDEEGMKSTQSPSRRLRGPAMPVSELAALHRITHGANPVFLEEARRLHAVDRALNMEWVTRGNSWQHDLWLYRATGETSWLASARTKADAEIAARRDDPPVDFREAGGGTFFDYLMEPWKEYYELWLETRDPAHLAAAHRGARKYAQLVWFYPSVPAGDITVNESGFAPRRGSLTKPGLVPVAKETVPAWRVSEQGLVCEGNGTVQRLALYLACHAPWFLRLSHDAEDPFLRDIARSAMVGRFAGFPGYHFNTRYSTAQEKAGFALHPHDDLKVTTSFHYNHTLPMAALVLDYLMADAYARSRGAIDFPAEYAEAYAYLGGRVFGEPGTFYDQTGVRPWMPHGLIECDEVQVNHVAARGSETFCLVFTNQCDRPLEAVEVRLNPACFDAMPESTGAKLWIENQPVEAGLPVEGGRFRISLAPKGITAVVLPGFRARTTFQHRLITAEDGKAAAGPGVVNLPEADARTVRLRFGKDLDWIYAWLDADESRVRSATLEAAGSADPVTDGAFPFEFRLPLVDGATWPDLRWTITRPDGGIDRFGPVRATQP